MHKIKFDFDDIVIVPDVTTSIDSRKECNPFVNESFLPIMTAPMYDVVTTDNYWKYQMNNIIPVLPRGTKNIDNAIFCARESVKLNVSIGLNDIVDSNHDLFYLLDLRNNKKNGVYERDSFILIDCANGHMNKVEEKLRYLLSRYPNEKFVVGNISNPSTFVSLALAGAWGIRLGIGNGSVCLTSANVAVGYPMASLIEETYELKVKYNLETKIIADGGFKNYSDIIKAYVLGADIVMVGGEFNKLQDTQYKGYAWNKIPVTGFLKKMAHKCNVPVYHDYRGMSTKSIQKFENKKKLVTSEGITKRNLSKYTLESWRDNFVDYLRSAMSYSNCRTISEFIGNQNYVTITQNSLKRFHK